MNPSQFVAKWSRNVQNERAAAQSHFNDLCGLLGHATPNDDPAGEHFAFEKGATKRGGGQGWADVWKRDCFAWEYKGKHKDLDVALSQVAQYAGALENPPLLVACDMRRLIIRANFNGYPAQTREYNLDSLADPLDGPPVLDTLRALFTEPQRLRPKQTTEEITQVAARELAALAEKMEARGQAAGTFDALSVARFLDRCVFCLFAEDVGLLPEKKLTKILTENLYNSARCSKLIAELFGTMATGGDFGDVEIRHFNGNLFDRNIALQLDEEGREVRALREAALKDWANVNPSIMGALFERALNPQQRKQLGAHYTSEEDIRSLVEPVVMEPLRRRWGEVQDALLAMAGEASGWRDAARTAVDDFRAELAGVRVLDPACGSGNFLYVTLQLMLNLEAQTHAFLVAQGLTAPGESLEPLVRPEQFHGLELNPYALDLAQTSLWVGYLQWRLRHGYPWPDEPILRSTSSFRLGDAILDRNSTPLREPEWPDCDFIVGNPPFLGDKKMRGELGADYVETLRRFYLGRVPGQADLCCYWFEKARRHIEEGRCRRAGLVATQAIRGGANREVLKRIKESGSIFFSVSDRDWILEGASVHISLVGFDDESETRRVLDGREVQAINSNLTAAADVTQARALAENRATGFLGSCKGGPFDILEAEAMALVHMPNPHGKPNSDVLRPVCNSQDLLARTQQRWIIDNADLSLAQASLYETPHHLVQLRVKPGRDSNRDKWLRENWWRPQRMRPEMRAAVAPLARFFVTPTTSKHRVFVWLPPAVLPDHQLIVFAREDDYSFGVLHSRVHEVWALSQGTQLRERESGFRYTPTTCFETFPFPKPTEEQREAIAAAALELSTLRENWLNPPAWIKTEWLEFPASAGGPWEQFIVPETVDASGVGTARYPRLAPRDLQMTVYETDFAPDGTPQTRALKLKDALPRRTLTNLYNQRPDWLRNTHRKLDGAVCAAYGWHVDITDEELLARLLELNQERSQNG